MLGGGFAVLQAPFVECFSFDPFSFQQDGLASSEVDIGGSEVAKALVIALVIVVRDKGIDLCFEMAGQRVVLEQDAGVDRSYFRIVVPGPGDREPGATHPEA
jgi:hypothetical protein